MQALLRLKSLLVLTKLYKDPPLCRHQILLKFAIVTKTAVHALLNKKRLYNRQQGQENLKFVETLWSRKAFASKNSDKVSKNL